MTFVPGADPDLLASYSFALPDDRIARHPLAVRSASRLLVVPRAGDLQHRHVTDLVELLDDGDCLVLNDTSVLPARLHGVKEGSGGRVELLLIRQDGDAWIALVQASKKPKPGSVLVFEKSGDTLRATLDTFLDDEPGAARVRFDGDAVAFATAHGHIPLPPYMARDDEEEDKTRYQTVYRDPTKASSAAAPTAGLHFDEPLLAALSRKGVRLATVTLHVGPGTFFPVRTERLSEHIMHPEPWWLPEQTARALNETKAAGKRVVAVGTTSLRTLESARRAQGDGPWRAGAGLTRLFVRPPDRITSVDALITNFHLPESTLFALVAAVAGLDRMQAAYAEAIAQGYRFYSYGDASWLDVV